MRRILGNLLLSLTVSALLLGGLEGMSRLLEERKPRAERAEYLWDWQTQWDGDFYTLASDESGWPPGAEFNGHGVRDRAHAVEKPEDTWRVAFLGDSVTFGDGNAPHEAYPQQSRPCCCRATSATSARRCCVTTRAATKRTERHLNK